MINRFFSWIRRRMDPIRYARSIGVKIGRDCRLVDVNFGSEPWLITLGDHVSISDTLFITHDGGVWVFRREHPNAELLAPITIGNNVFIGSGTIVLPGTTIGDNVVVGAASVVSRNIPSNCVAAGAPAKPIKTIEAYQAKVLPNCQDTKSLPAASKRRFYEAKFAR